MGYDEEIDGTAIFDESPDDSVHEGETEVIGISFSEPQGELVSESTKKVNSIPNDGKVEGADDAEHESSFSINSESGIKMKERLHGETADLDTSHASMVISQLPDNHVSEKNTDSSQKDDQVSLPEEKPPSEDKRLNLKPRDSVGQSRRYTPRNESKGSDNKANKTVPLRSKPEKKNAEAPNKCSMHKTPKYEPGSKIKGADEINSAGKELIRRITVKPQSSASQKVSSRVHRSANRIKPAPRQIEPPTRRDSSSCSFQSNERTMRRKEFDKKLEERMHAKEAAMNRLKAKTQPKAEIKQLRKSISFKAIPSPSFYLGASRNPDVNKAKASNAKPQSLNSKSSHPGTRTAKSPPLSSKAGLEQVATKTTNPSQASGTTSCHSTVTSESSASSPAGTSYGRYSQARTRTPVSQKKDQKEEKPMSLRHSKVAEGNQRQKMRTERTTYTSFNSSSRTGRMAVGVAS